MYLRLYFLLPDEDQARKVVNHLLDEGLHARNIHAHQHSVDMSKTDLPAARMWKKLDLAQQVEDVAWRTDLIIFFIALAVFLVAVFMANILFTVISAVIMLACFLLGNMFAGRVPHVHLKEFEHALSHGEVLLMVDVPRTRVAEIEQLVQQHHPSAIIGGSSWTVHTLGI